VFTLGPPPDVSWRGPVDLACSLVYPKAIVFIQPIYCPSFAACPHVWWVIETVPSSVAGLYPSEATSGISDDTLSDSVRIIPWIITDTFGWHRNFQLYVVKLTSVDVMLTFCAAAKHGLVLESSLACCLSAPATVSCIPLRELSVSVLKQIVLVLLRLWVLWDRRTRLVVSTLILFVLTQVTSVVCTAYVVASMMRESSELSVGILTGLWCSLDGLWSDPACLYADRKSEFCNPVESRCSYHSSLIWFGRWCCNRLYLNLWYLLWLVGMPWISHFRNTQKWRGWCIVTGAFISLWVVHEGWFWNTADIHQVLFGRFIVEFLCPTLIFFRTAYHKPGSVHRFTCKSAPSFMSAHLQTW